MISRPDHFQSPSPGDGASPSHPSRPTSAPRGGGFIHDERCDCGECRCRYRQGDSIASHDASTVSVGWTLVLLAASALLIWGWIELLT